MFRSVVMGCGAYLPAKTVTNADLAAMVDTSDDWIAQRTGIRERHIVGDDEKTSDLALAAATRALDAAGIDANGIDLIVLATTTADQTFPATAVCMGWIFASWRGLIDERSRWHGQEHDGQHAE